MLRIFLSSLIAPLPIFWILLILVVAAYLLRRTRTARILLFIALGWLLAFSTPFFPDFLVSKLEQQYLSYPGLQTGGKPNILVLGGGHTDDFRLPASDQLSQEALGRLVEGIRIHRMIPGSRLVTSGGQIRSSISQAKVLKNSAILLGVADSLIITLDTPRNTLAEAKAYRERWGLDTPLIVVTSATHMPRAMMLFKRQGLNPIAAPTNHLVKKGTYRPITHYLPSSEHLEKAEKAFHEYVGLVVGKLEK